MEILISAMLPIALVALVGFGVGRSFELDMQTLARINIYALLPALVLTSLAQTTLALGNAIAIVASFLLNTVVLYLLAVGLSRRLDFSVDEQKSLIAIVLFSNVGNLGLPFILFALGEAGLERAVVYLVGSSVMIASVFPIVLKQAGLKAGLNVTLRLPVLWAALTGIGLQATQEAFPLPLERGITLLGEGAIPVALLTLGVQLARTELVFGRYELIGSVLRLGVAPLLAYGIGTALGLQGLDRQVLVLQAAMPVAVNSLIWVTELGGDRTRVARTILLSTFLSVITLPVVLWLSSR
ncbi:MULTISPECIES: AEC family transporter [Cyanophyceae]|uniref:AEC family transporter n=1 Tax=Cyanophyceae TaxID=3028117 RepID=UPI0016876154|nr:MULTISPECIES: AEC family transporter [Cyanophyceae]MBD1916722.1 AEC family transporter [Phormidium sp. FACHB-77]MBD2029352.1 AEC family transporter [Phormidium sp. FACHB-322]MBD2051927.1 AEC family transporter [Leptolyngbya sp. FACHB-60]